MLGFMFPAFVLATVTEGSVVAWANVFGTRPPATAITPVAKRALTNSLRLTFRHVLKSPLLVFLSFSGGASRNASCGRCSSCCYHQRPAALVEAAGPWRDTCAMLVFMACSRALSALVHGA